MLKNILDIQYEHSKHITVIVIINMFTCTQIGLDDLNWEKNFETFGALYSAHENKEYPPRFTLEFCGKNAKSSVTVTISLTNVMRPVSYGINLYMIRESFQRQCMGTLNIMVLFLHLCS